MMDAGQIFLKIFSIGLISALDIGACPHRRLDALLGEYFYRLGDDRIGGVANGKGAGGPDFLWLRRSRAMLDLQPSRFVL